MFFNCFDKYILLTRLIWDLKYHTSFTTCFYLLFQLGISLCLSYQTIKTKAIDYVADRLLNSTILPHIKIFIHVMDGKYLSCVGICGILERPCLIFLFTTYGSYPY
jgi:hypothetical protein